MKISEIFKLSKEELFAKIKEANALTFVPLGKSEPRYSEKAISIAQIIEKGDFGCKTKAIIQLFSLVLNEELPDIEKDKNIERPIFEYALLKTDEIFYFIQEVTGTHSHISSKSIKFEDSLIEIEEDEYEFWNTDTEPNDEEIKEFIEALYKI